MYLLMKRVVKMVYKKDEIRRAYIARLQQLDQKSREKDEKRLLDRLYVQPEWVNARTVAVTLSQAFEINTAPLILHARHKGKQVLIPRTLPNRQMEFVDFNEDTNLVQSKFGVLEPENGKVVSPANIDLIVVPGVAFTKHGKRLGFGGGYYDRYLADYKGVTVALVLPTQLAPENDWVSEEFDIDVQNVITLLDN